MNENEKLLRWPLLENLCGRPWRPCARCNLSAKNSVTRLSRRTLCSGFSPRLAACLACLLALLACLLACLPYPTFSVLFPGSPRVGSFDHSVLTRFHVPGTIELHELQQVMRKLGQNPTERELSEMIRSVDDNGDMEIDFDEFLLLMKGRVGARDPEQELRDAFAVFDTDNSGAIDRKELKRLMKKLGQALSEAELDAMMDEVDENGDGEISFEEFKALMLN